MRPDRVVFAEAKLTQSEARIFLTCCDFRTPMSPQVAGRAMKFCSLIASAARCECLLPPDQVDFVSDANLEFSTRYFDTF